MSVVVDDLQGSKPVVVLTPENTGWDREQAAHTPTGKTQAGGQNSASILDEIVRDSFGSGVVDAGEVLRERVGEGLRRITAKDFGFGLDNQDDFHIVKPSNLLSLRTELQALLDSSVNALNSDPSGQNTQRVLLDMLSRILTVATLRAEATDAETQAVMLDVMERSAQFVEANVAVPQFNGKEATGVRTLVFNVYHRLAKVLGRNTPEAVKADTKSMLIALGDRIVHRPGQGKRADMTPSEHIEKVIAPVLDEDMRSFAFIQSMYSFPKMENFHGLIKTWRRRGHDLGKVVIE